MAEEGSRQLDESIQMLFDALVRMDTETDNEALQQWCENICQPEYAIVDGLVANFVQYQDDKDYLKHLMKVLK